MNHGSLSVTVSAIVPTRLDANATLQDAVAAPTQLASTAGTSFKLPDNSWSVPQQSALETFLYPPEVARYNFNLASRMLKPELARRQPSQPGGGYNPTDALVLEPLGDIMLITSPNTICWREEWACSGASAFGKTPPNCHRLCAGGIGMCIPDCARGSKAHHACSVHHEGL